jgi:hypothetical protein
MDWLILFYFGCLTITTVFAIAYYFIERYLDETHPVMKWWRKNIVGLNPYPDDNEDDFYE